MLNELHPNNYHRELSPMKAICLVGREKIEIGEVEDLSPGEGEVAIAPEYVGICGTDLHVYLGQSEDRVSYPAILGHEFVGRVADLGKGVRGFEVGERVVVDPVIPCRQCPLCKAGRFNTCINLEVLGIDCPGALAGRVVVRAGNVLKLPESVDPRHGIMVELYSVAVHSWRITKVETGDVAVVLGAGKVGLSLVDVLRQSPAEKLVAVDVLAPRLQVAKEIGADVIINSRETDPVKEVLRLTAGVGADKVIEAVGHAVEVSDLKPPMYLAMQMLRPGGQITAMGQGGLEELFFWKPFVLKEATIVSSRLNLGDMPRAIKLLAHGKLHPDRIITHTIAPDQVQQGFEMMRTDPARVIKVVVDVRSLSGSHSL